MICIFDCDLLNRAALTTITLKVKSPYIKMHEQHLQKNMFVKVENFCIESKSKRRFEKGDMHVIITIESTTIVSLILAFQL
jgi:copper(I)-binding protein